MKNIDIINKISQGMYVLTTQNGGCVVDAVMQISAGDNPLIAISVMKKNYTNELLKENSNFAISILSQDVDANIIKTFGFNSMRDINKFENVKYTSINGINVIDDSIGYMICEKIDSIDNDTHTLFIGRIIEADKYNEKEEMTYNYYREHKDELLKVKTEKNETAWICTVCGYVYYGEELPDNYTCPICSVGKELFKKQ